LRGTSEKPWDRTSESTKDFEMKRLNVKKKGGGIFSKEQRMGNIPGDDLV